MAYPNSHLVDPSTYDTALDGLAANIPLRISRSAALIDRGAFRAQKDWQQIFNSLPPSSYAGTAGPHYGFVSACMPETLPDRAELVGYVAEMTFLVDDAMDDADSPAAVAAAPYITDLMRAHDAIRRGVEADAMLVGGSPVARLFVAVGRAMLAVDAGRARDAFSWLEGWVKTVLARPRGEKDIRDLDSYLEYRRSNLASK
jgi:fusicocca-2,10(14)-diene synthase/ophiobolin F synthase